ncbi:dihydrolipoamide acetyltransferase family protein [Sporosarcina sp. P13]|uniref:dihydrolipoamide acetyltransferase family protein n=1 Tax=Sporosarcina sp. P13 TaxID=2048263 RepID=UPI0018EE2104
MKLPELGEGIFEGEILEWRIKQGDSVVEDDIIAEVQNDKAVVELPSPFSGKVVEIKVAEGEVCTVEDTILVLEVKDVTNATSENVVENKEPEQDMASTTVTSAAVPPSSEGIQGKQTIKATPSVRKLAREKGVSLHLLTPTGKDQRITREDVLAFDKNEQNRIATTDIDDAPIGKNEISKKEQKIPSSLPSLMEEALEERSPIRGIRKVIANAMVKSAYTIPHVTIMDEVEVGGLVAIRTKAKSFAEEKGVQLTYLPFIVKALIAGLTQFPVLNSSIDEETNEIVYKKYYNIGIATDTDNGLLVPVIKSAERKNIWAIASEIKDLSMRGRAGKLNADELKGSTITITNIGSTGGMIFTPIINYPEVAILGIGRITEKPIIKNKEIVAASMMNLSLSFDHRIIDGATAQKFLNYIKQLLEDPRLLVLEV